MKLEKLQKEIEFALAGKKALVKRKAKGFIKHDYLVPSGPYEEQWDWDGFFVGMSLASEIPSEAIYLKNWCLNYLENVHEDGFTPGLLTPQGIDRRLKHVKPFLAQGCYFASNYLKDFSWISLHWENLKKAVEYREKTYFDKKFGLGCWYNGMESGADNNVAVLGYPNGSVIATDLNTFLYREYRAMALIAQWFHKKEEKKYFDGRAETIKVAIKKYLWDENDAIFCNLDTITGTSIKRVTYSCIVPLWDQIATRKEGRKMILKYVLNPQKLWARCGVRTLAADDPDYNQANIIKPYSNWQGPVWPIVNYLAMHSLLQYGFSREARQLGEIISRLCLEDIKKTGGMHENYNADTGKPLAAPNFVSWNLLAGQMIPQAKMRKNPFRLS